MIYEALSCGAQVGLLPMPRVKNAGRVAKGVEALVEEGALIRYEDWMQVQSLPIDGLVLMEAEGCAKRFPSR